MYHSLGPSLSCAVLCIVVSWCSPAVSLNNGLGRTPPMGFNTWNYFACNINETVIRVAADRLVTLGLADAGYTYLNLDDCWATRARDATGQLQPDPAKFPSGMQALALSIQQKGLQFGIYADAGLFTCAGFPGSRYHEADDAALFASWGVDYLKYDNCFSAALDVQQRYTAMHDALNSTGRPIYFSMCEWGVAGPWHWAASVGNSWRTDADIAPSWDSVLRCLDNGAAGLARFAGPGGWNDPDMLEVGVSGLTPAQQRSHFALWALVKAPLLIGADLASISATSLKLLLSKEVIAINQDRLGVAGDIIWKEGPLEVWAGPLDGDARAVVLFNRHHAGLPEQITVTWAQLGYKPGFKAAVRDLYAEKDLGVHEQGFTATVANYDVAVLRISHPTKPSGTAGRRHCSSSSRCGACGGRCNGGAFTRWVRGLWSGAASSDACCVSSERVPGWQRMGCDSAASKESLAKPSGCEPPQHVTLSADPDADVAGGTAAAAAAADEVRNGTGLEAVWRPWHDAAAAELQHRLRAAAAAGRQQRPAQGRKKRHATLQIV